MNINHDRIKAVSIDNFKTNSKKDKSKQMKIGFKSKSKNKI